MLRGHLLRCSLRSSSSSAEGALSVAEFAPNSATFGLLPLLLFVVDPRPADPVYRSANFGAWLRLPVAVYGQALADNSKISRPRSACSCKLPKPGFFSTVPGSSLRYCRT